MSDIENSELVEIKGAAAACAILCLEMYKTLPPDKQTAIANALREELERPGTMSDITLESAARHRALEALLARLGR